MLTNVKKTAIKILKLLGDQPIVHLSVSYLTPNNRFKGKKIMVSGGTSGIGYAISKSLLKEGAEVLVCARKKEGIDSVVKECAGYNIKGMQLDLADAKSLKGKINEAVTLMGNIDIFINAAGVSAYDEDIMTDTMYDYICDINQKGLFFICNYEGEYLVANGIHGKIINITSKAGEMIQYDPYTLSKWGANSITKGLARKLAPYHINVNGIAPGRVPTNITKELQSHIGSDNVFSNNLNQRFTMPEEIAELAMFLASESSNNIFGQIINIDGGVYK